jgi:hypothetical protein
MRRFLTAARGLAWAHSLKELSVVLYQPLTTKKNESYEEEFHMRPITRLCLSHDRYPGRHLIRTEGRGLSKKGWFSGKAGEAANYQGCITRLFFRHNQSRETTYQEVVRMIWGQI